MTKTTRALSGAAKNAFLDGVVRSALGEDHAAHERLMQELTAAVASLRVRVEAERAAAIDTASAQATRAENDPEAEPESADDSIARADTPPFDPFSPNVIVLLRREGRDAAVSALMAIGHEDRLRLLAKEQQLSLPTETLPASALCEAIVSAAERRIANRWAAGR